MIGTAPPPRIGTPRDESHVSLGDYFISIQAQLGYEAHEWQRLLFSVSTELEPRTAPHRGQSALKLMTQHVGCMVGRQSGKTAWAVARVVGQAVLPSRPDIAELVGLPRIIPQHIAYTAQSRMNAVGKWREHVDIIQGSEAGQYVESVRYSIGSECLTFANGSTYRPVTPNRGGARGLTLDLVIVDEALTHPMWLLSTLRPTMAQRHGANGCIGTQFVVISNAGNHDSELLNHIQELGHESIKSGNRSRVWLEWSMKPDSDPLKPSTWLETMPTVNQPNGIDLDFLREESESMRLEDFMREYLCVRVARSRMQLIPNDRWMELYRTDVVTPPDSVIALDVSPDRQRASIVACGAVGDYLPVEVVESKEGLDWVIDHVQAIAERWGCSVAIDAGGHAGSMIPVLQARGVDVIAFAAREVASSAACFYDNVQNKRITHLNDYRLNDAIAGASKRAVAERWAFDRRANVDITPLVAASFAVWVVDTGQVEKGTLFT